MITEALKLAYRWHRELPRMRREHGRFTSETAAVALKYAREDVAAQRNRYPGMRGACIGAESYGLQWVENPAAIGLRFVGFADEIAPRRVDHKGWYSRDEDFGEVFRGVVYQFPARDGQAVYVAGYREGETRGRGWSDTSGTEGARLALRELIYGEPGDGGDRYDAPQGARDAASRADSIAEYQAEESRDYDRAWQAGVRFADLGSEIATDRKAALALIKEIKAARPFGTAICEALRDKVESLLQSISDARAERDKLTNDTPNALHAAFNEGAGAIVLAV